MDGRSLPDVGGRQDRNKGLDSYGPRPGGCGRLHGVRVEMCHIEIWGFGALDASMIATLLLNPCVSLP